MPRFPARRHRSASSKKPGAKRSSNPLSFFQVLWFKNSAQPETQSHGVGLFPVRTGLMIPSPRFMVYPAAAGSCVALSNSFPPRMVLGLRFMALTRDLRDEGAKTISSLVMRKYFPWALVAARLTAREKLKDLPLFLRSRLVMTIVWMFLEL